MLGRFFGIAADRHAYAALFYIVPSLATGIFYFAWVVAGTSMSAGFAVLIIGIPFVILFLGSIRMLSLLEEIGEHTSELQSLMRISYAVFCLKKKKQHHKQLT